MGKCEDEMNEYGNIDGITEYVSGILKESSNRNLINFDEKYIKSGSYNLNSTYLDVDFSVQIWGPKVQYTAKEKEDELKATVTKLQDPDYVARYAREKYLYSKDGEIIIRIPE